VAIKIIKSQLIHDLDAMQQFQLEAEITGRLVHPGIAPVYAKGITEDGSPFYAMQFVEGRDLNEEIDTLFEDSTAHFDGLLFSRLLSAFVSVCKTVAYAHSRGVIHRDIKPQNIRIGKFNEVFVLDWGLAIPVQRSAPYRAGDETTMVFDKNAYSTSRSGGTPAYMSPEQVSGLALTPSSDIYSLGATMYRILTGKSPIEGISSQSVLSSVMEGRITSPCELQPALPKQLGAICMKAMAVQPTSRYDTAMELAQDIELYLAGSAVTCYQETPYERCGRWLRANQAWARHIAFGLVVVAIASVIAAVFTSQLAANRDEQRKMAETRGEEATVAREQAEQAKRQSLALAAQLGARSIAAEIELRGALLREEAASPVLRRLVARLNAKPQDEESLQKLNSWVRDRFLHNVSESLPTSSWTIQGKSGLQLARAATRDAESNVKSIGKSFRHRDYFHASGKDFEPDSPEALEAVAHSFHVHVSSAYVSLNTSKLSVAFSTPIYADTTGGDEDNTESDTAGTNEIIGIILSTVLLDKMDLLPGSILVDLRENTIEKQKLVGMVLRHHALDGDYGGKLERRCLSQDDLIKIQEVLSRSSTLKTSIDNASLNRSIEIMDPVDNRATKVAAAAVVLANQPGHSRVGWVVLMKDTEHRSP